jgi:hypothetical protein
MKKMTIIGITAVCTFCLTLFLTLIVPDFIKERTEDSLVNNSEVSQLLKGAEIESISYVGNDTYMIIANNKKYIAMKDYYSLMNYKWYLFEKINEWG